MAELAIPLLALGSLYIGCNDNNKKSGGGSTANGTNLLKEGMQNYSRGQSGQKRQLLPNTNMSSVNYPVHYLKQAIQLITTQMLAKIPINILVPKVLNKSITII